MKLLGVGLPKLNKELKFTSNLIEMDDEVLKYLPTQLSYYTKGRVLNSFYDSLGLYNRSFYKKLLTIDREYSKTLLAKKLKAYEGPLRFVLLTNSKYAILDTSQISQYELLQDKFKANKVSSDNNFDGFFLNDYYKIELTPRSGLFIKLNSFYDNVDIYEYTYINDIYYTNKQGETTFSTDSYESLSYYDEVSDDYFSNIVYYYQDSFNKDVLWKDLQVVNKKGLTDSDKIRLSDLNEIQKEQVKSSYSVGEVLVSLSDQLDKSLIKIKDYLKLSKYLLDKYS